MHTHDFLKQLERDLSYAIALILLVIVSNFFLAIHIAVNITMIALPIAYMYKSLINDGLRFMLNGGLEKLNEYELRKDLLDESQTSEYTDLVRINRLVSPVLSRLPQEAKTYYSNKV